jgi:hypothetical protein
MTNEFKTRAQIHYPKALREQCADPLEPFVKRNNRCVYFSIHQIPEPADFGLNGKGCDRDLQSIKEPAAIFASRAGVQKSIYPAKE